ncbi:MAG: hypothetical protein WCC69_11835 [Pirellulales bacterium]
MSTLFVRTSTSLILVRLSVAVLLVGGNAGLVAAAEPPARLAERERELVRQYAELELSFLRLADLLDASDPRRAAALRSACEMARSEQVSDRLATIVELLQQGQLLKAGTTQQQAIDQLQSLLDRLAAGAEPQRPGDTTREVRAFLGRLSKAIARQREIADATESGRGDDDLAARQDALAKESRGLADDLGRFADRMAAGTPTDDRPTENTPPGAPPPDTSPADAPPADGGQQGERNGNPGSEATPPQSAADDGPAGGEPPADAEPEGDDEAARAKRSRRRLIAAQQRMDAARKQLEQANRGDSRREQDRALEELENARAELEEILRQVREEEVERLLVQLEARVREMLRAERGVQSAADALAARASIGRERELAAAKLGRDQEAVGAAATKALALIRDDGTAVAIPQALEQIRDDAQQAATRLTRGDVGGTTRGIVGDLVSGLEEMLAALEKAQRDRQEQEKQAKSFGGSPPQPGDQPLVDALAELKMIRSLQLRVNGRTQRFAALLGEGVEQADEPELRQALERLAARQRLIEQAAHDIVSGRTE